MTRILFRAVLVAGIVVLAALSVVWSRPLTAPLPDGVYMEEMTWVEVRELIRGGATTVIVPTGGIEQGGPHLVIGKHNYIVRHTAGRIAEALGNTLVAPVMVYVPEGDIESRAGHMAFAGTLSLPEPVFAAVLENTARSLRAHGFKVIALLGDSGGNQAAQAAVAEKLNGEWVGSGTRVIHVADYYDPAVNGQIAWLRDQGESEFAIGSHAGIRDTAELMAVYPEGVRPDRMAWQGGMFKDTTGVIGDPTKASVERGEVMLRLKVEAALRQIRAEMAIETD
jgi:creatinine amidohydrolase/Fe(II)-dependent formamide hydrolase-like protein